MTTAGGRKQGGYTKVVFLATRTPHWSPVALIAILRVNNASIPEATNTQIDLSRWRYCTSMTVIIRDCLARQTLETQLPSLPFSLRS